MKTAEKVQIEIPSTIVTQKTQPKKEVKLDESLGQIEEEAKAEESSSLSSSSDDIPINNKSEDDESKSLSSSEPLFSSVSSQSDEAGGRTFSIKVDSLSSNPNGKSSKGLKFSTKSITKLSKDGEKTRASEKDLAVVKSKTAPQGGSSFSAFGKYQFPRGEAPQMPPKAK